ncbi:MAG: hypothetical protein NUV84_00385 [Candidatus Uhrbacteria bacterium]|nr:hypothetical protein [Candidatus Uhrbacteria bacterium]
MSKRLCTIVIVIAVFVVLAVVLVLFRQQQQAEDTQPGMTQEEAQVAPEVADTVTESIPQTSPTKNTNPFADSYKNPFE